MKLVFTSSNFTVADEAEDSDVTVTLTKNGVNLVITLNVEGDGSDTWTCAATYTELTF